MKALVAALLALLLYRQPASVSFSVQRLAIGGLGWGCWKGPAQQPGFPGRCQATLGIPAQPGRGHAQDDQDYSKDEDEEEQGDEDEEDEDEEAGATEGSRGRGLQCYTCQNLPQHEHCNQTHSCLPSQPFCKTLISEGDTESGPLTTYSVWCADKCKPITRMAGGTLITITCCQTNLCNTTPSQSRPGTGAGGPQGSPKTVATALFLSLLPGLGAMGS